MRHMSFVKYEFSPDADFAGYEFAAHEKETERMKHEGAGEILRI